MGAPFFTSKDTLLVRANKNSVKVMGAICMKLTLPTGKEESFTRAIPRREPVQAMCYCSAFSQKYVMELIALGQSCTWSKIMRVFSGRIF